MPAPAADRVVLLGFMGSGKTTVGARLAAALGWRHLDLDREIEHAEGRTVREIFADDGEARFRRLEAEVGARLLARPRTVLTPGGGWAAQPGRLESLPEGVLSVWLRVSAAEALRRVSVPDEAGVRPLLDGPDVEARVRALLAERERRYRLAQHHVNTDGRAPRDVVREIESIVRGRTPAAPQSS